MSDLYQLIQSDVLKYRKEHNTAALKCMLPLLGDIQKIGKDKRRDITTEDCFTVLKSTLKNLNIILSTPNISEENRAAALFEINLLTGYLPEAPDQLIVDGMITVMKAEGKNKGQIIKDLKAEFGSTFDVSEIAKSL